ncbi:hypothetical protein J437_LFUL005933 [Ladona fulva]|uniref:MIF4G domain-containing protein n=1 Tax=Ladona fulva TaxID=123851 RepID=A0A8K0K0T4_LADFU|nr:hypothetical protein J437_LFUL005933 [Ladona fulva]
MHLQAASEINEASGYQRWARHEWGGTCGGRGGGHSDCRRPQKVLQVGGLLEGEEFRAEATGDRAPLSKDDGRSATYQSKEERGGQWEFREKTRLHSDSSQNGTAPHLNVHAKEFSANKSQSQHQIRSSQSQHSSGILTSKSSGSIAMHSGGVLQRPSSSSSSSSSSSNGSSKPSKKKSTAHLSLSRSSGDLSALQQLPQRAVHFLSEINQEHKHKMGKKHLSRHESMSSSNIKREKHQGQQQAGQASQVEVQPVLSRVSAYQTPLFAGLKRSKSMSAATEFAPCPEAPDLGPFSPQVQSMVRQAVQDPNELPARALMELVRNIFDRIAEDRKYALPAAKLCITIIEKEHHQETFLESLLNTCLQWYRQREQEMQLAMKGSNTSPGSATKWLSFLSFLNEMYQQLKRRELQLQTKTEGVAPDMFLLGLMHGCLLSSLDTPAALNSLVEIDSIFIIIMCIGSDLEREQPQRMLSLMASVRDALLSLDVVRIPKNRRTLLELVEVRAASWKLPAPAVMYYYPSSNDH